MTHSHDCVYWMNRACCNCGMVVGMAPEPLGDYEGVGTLLIFQYRENSNIMAHPLRVEDVLYDTVTTEKGILVVEDERGEVTHVPNVAYYKVEPKA